MELQEIELTIGKNGQVKIHVHGIKGKKCLELTEELEKALGNTILERKETPEAFENPVAIPIERKVDVKS